MFENFYQQMFNLGMRLLTNHHDTEDVLIIAFTKVFDKIEDFEYRGDKSLQKWIKTIIINESIRFLEQKKELILLENPIMAECEALPYDGQISFDTEQAYSIIENMPAGYRTIFNLFAIEGYTHQEISGLLQITISTSKSQLCKARNHIITKLKNLNPYGITKIGS